MQSFLRTNQTDLRTMISNIVADLVSGGMVVVSDLELAGGVGHRYILKPDLTVDLLIETQDWRFVIDVGDNYYDYYACHALQVNETDGTIADTGETSKSGRLTPNNSTEENFFSYGETPTWSVYESLPEGSAGNAVPLSSLVTIAARGFSISTWAEGQDNRGDCFNWLVVQRPVKDDGVVITEGLAPLFCVFSRNGGGSRINMDEIIADGILKFVVCESDISAPTKPISAVIPLPDSHPIINPIQQVGIAETREYVMHLPKGLNTHRYFYDASLDLIGYTSADVISSGSEDEVYLFGSTEPSKFRALNSNFQNGRGMRLLVQIQQS